MKLQANNSETDAHLAIPASGKGPGVLVLHPWWGLNEDITNVADRLAEAGFVALAPDLYNGRIATTIEQAEKFSTELDDETANPIIEAAIDELLAHEACEAGQIGVLGFSMGAMFAVWAAHKRPAQVSAVVLFYGAGWINQTDTQANYLGHYAENDSYEDSEFIDLFKEKLLENGRPTTFHIYPNTGHWFFEPSRPDAYDEAASQLAWERTLAFLNKTLG